MKNLVLIILLCCGSSKASTLTDNIDIQLTNVFGMTLITNQIQMALTNGIFVQTDWTHNISPGDGGQIISDNLASIIDSLGMGWSNLVDIEFVPLLMRVRIDSYKGEQGVIGTGWVVIMEVTEDSETLQRHINFGPESSRSRAWAEIGRPALDFRQGLAAYWPLIEASGSRSDSWTNALTLTDVEEVGQGVGNTYDDAADFEADDSQTLTRASESLLSFGDTDFSVGAWVNFESLGADQVVMSKFNQTGNNREWLIGYDNMADRLAFWISSAGTQATLTKLNADTLGSPSTGVWYFICATHDATADEVTITVNGLSDGASHSGGAFEDGSPFAIGAGHVNTPMNFTDGRIGPAFIYDLKLSTIGINDLFNAGRGLRFNEL